LIVLRKKLSILVYETVHAVQLLKVRLRTIAQAHQKEQLTMDLIGTLHRMYKTLMSPLIGKRCRFYPSCSDYCLSCVRRFGYLRGGVLTATRLARCQPFGAPGYDPVPQHFVWMSSVQPAPQASVEDPDNSG
jgi:uncharacterized protein